MRIIEVLVSILIIVLVLSVGAFSYLSAQKGFESIRSSSISIREIIKTDLKIRDTVQGAHLSYLSNRKNQLNELEQKILNMDYGEDINIINVSADLKDSADIFSSINVKVSWSAGGKNYETKVSF